ncbi:hypothetical protein ETAA8_20980 [Anatilimnocola aggregata]|uniref:Uncharacterized protein n=1 Tax=Anatilimnocola aggregata TaxID=2528021 RepID=A0A517Y9W4_9BACT|nr:hypothetical protein [Anatilimnocola aggregata]QDU27014.1 hypothetical protein ETAA8_20980 [Anatilimnocola aggregata]
MTNERDESETLLDQQLSCTLRGTDYPPRDLEQRTRQVIRQHVRRRVLVRSVSASVAFLILFSWQAWNRPATQRARDGLQLAELEALFAPPPVDPLSLLDRQQSLALGALRRLENNQ